MRDLKIAVAAKVDSKHWQNQLITFDELKEKLKTTYRTTETVEIYKKLKIEEKSRIKDHGGFLGGELKDRRKTNKNVMSRSLLTLDLDDAEVDFLEKYKRNSKYETLIYTTHSHTPEAPRLRLILPLTRDITSDEYNAIARFYADSFGIAQFDPCSFKVAQMMFWPSTPKDGEFIYEEVEGKWLDPDTFLGDYPNWRNVENLPLHPNEVKPHEIGKEAEDPLKKTGMIGAFCRTYSISKVIDKFLSDVYEPTTIPNKYTYIKGSSYGGLITFNDKFAYSFHATDPANGQLCNAFDLVRIHKFGSTGRKSLKDMFNFASKDEDVKLALAVEQFETLKDDFKEDDEFKITDFSWMTKLKRDPMTNLYENSTENLILILENDPKFKNFAYNEFAKLVEIIGAVPWRRERGNKYWLDSDDSQIKAIIDKAYLPFSERNYKVSFEKITRDRSFHPIMDYFDSLPKWDGIKRVDDCFIKYFNAENSEYTKQVTRKAFVAAVSRIFKPGTKFDNVLVLDGEQGIGKSSFIKFLASDNFFCDSLSLTDMNDKTGSEKLQGSWILEIGELSGMKKADIEKVKSFLSSTDDKYRSSYGRTVESHPRQCVIFATVNGKKGYLRDITGNRRFWIIKLGKTSEGWAWPNNKEFRDQFWAECIEYYKNGEPLYIDGDVLKKAQEIQSSAMEVDERAGMVKEYLDTLLPANWPKMDIYARREFFDGNSLTIPNGEVIRDSVSNAEIWCECFKKNLSDMKPMDSYSIASIMIQIGGWSSLEGAKRIPIYGLQRQYKRLV